MEMKTQVLKINDYPKNSNPKLKLKKPNFELPVKFRSVDFFKAIDIIRSSIKSSENELSRNKVSNTIEYPEHVKYYCSNITK